MKDLGLEILDSKSERSGNRRKALRESRKSTEKKIRGKNR